MKKTYLAAAAILGAAIFAGEAHAVKLTYGDGKSFKMGFRAKINATYKGKRKDTDKSDLILSVPNARIYAKGSISKIFKWAFQADMGFNEKWYDQDKKGLDDLDRSTPEVIDAFIMLDFAKEFKIMAGSIKLPFELHSGIQSGWSYLMPTGPAYGLGKGNPFKNPANVTVWRSGSRSPLAGAWGKVADGLVKYYVGITDGTDENGQNTKTGYFARIELTPVMLGYKGHPGYVLKEAYLGKQNTLTLGVSYFSQKIKGETANSLGVDLLWEQKMGLITPNISIGYVDHKNWKGNKDADGKGLLVQGQILLNQKTILGKPAIGARWAQADPDGLGGVKKKSSVIGVVAQLYVKGVSNRIALSIDRVKDDNKTTPNKDSWTDINLAFWYSF